MYSKLLGTLAIPFQITKVRSACCHTGPRVRKGRVLRATDAFLYWLLEAFQRNRRSEIRVAVEAELRISDSCCRVNGAHGKLEESVSDLQAVMMYLRSNDWTHSYHPSCWLRSYWRKLVEGHWKAIVTLLEGNNERNERGEDRERSASMRNFGAGAKSKPARLNEAPSSFFTITWYSQ